MKVGIYTLGCKVNTYESEFVTKSLMDAGYEISSFDDVCDIYIINTCTVTNTSDIKSRKIIRQAKRRNPNAIVIAMGCFVQKSTELIDEIDIAIGNKDKSKITELIKEYQDNSKKINKVVSKESLNEFEDMYIDKYLSRTRAFVKIQDGCENYCSYCIIPFVRGKCRSKDFDKTISEIKNLVANGFKEIVLTGIHTGNYGRDINTSFASLLAEMVKIDGLKRIRISSIEATELNKEVLNIIKENDIIVDHLHIPIQAASNEVLEIMNRKYNLDEFKSKINEIRTIRPDISITTDIIVGFPGETDEDFKDTIELAEELKFDLAYTFIYSPREGTPASIMKDETSMEVKKIRLARLNEIINKNANLNNQKYLDKIVPVLIESKSEKEDKYMGYTDTMKLVNVDCDKKYLGKIVNVKITDIKTWSLDGVVIDD